MGKRNRTTWRASPAACTGLAPGGRAAARLRCTQEVPDPSSRDLPTSGGKGSVKNPYKQREQGAGIGVAASASSQHTPEPSAAQSGDQQELTRSRLLRAARD